MTTLVTVGDSWTYGSYYPTSRMPSRLENTYGDYLASLIGCDHINLGQSASSLEYVIRVLYDFFSENDGDTVVVVGLTSPFRFPIYDNVNKRHINITQHYLTDYATGDLPAHNTWFHDLVGDLYRVSLKTFDEDNEVNRYFANMKHIELILKEQSTNFIMFNQFYQHERIPNMYNLIEQKPHFMDSNIKTHLKLEELGVLYDCGHPTLAGHQLIAEELYKIYKGLI